MGLMSFQNSELGASGMVRTPLGRVAESEPRHSDARLSRTRRPHLRISDIAQRVRPDGRGRCGQGRRARVRAKAAVRTAGA
ncbi:hypothetical protein Acsp04_58440 [Actinomadura sp. NBRC 104425]|nr:hypothetical protein Acsp04_58440 [Actinomadura sp. NBRC 104425]